MLKSTWPRVVACVVALLVAVLIAAWVSGGPQPTRHIVQPVELPE